jgi:hypothetical protein
MLSLMGAIAVDLVVLLAATCPHWDSPRRSPT